MRVFITYSKEREQAERVAVKLRALGFIVFFDQDAIRASESFDERIRGEAERADLLVFLVSPASVAKGSYALTELSLVSSRWPNPKDRVLPVMVRETPLADVPSYIKETVEILKPTGDLATETAAAAAAIRMRRRRPFRAGILATIVLAILVFGWALARSVSAASDLTTSLLAAGLKEPQYTDTCVTSLDSFSQYTRRFEPVPFACNPQKVLDSVTAPALIVAEPGGGKRGALQYVRHRLAEAGRPSILVSWQDCRRDIAKDAPLDIYECIAKRLLDVDHNVAPNRAREWAARKTNYVLLFDAIDDSFSRPQIYQLVKSLKEHQQQGGSVIMSARAEALEYFFGKYSLESWVQWLRDEVPTVVIRGISVSSVERVATTDQHHVPSEEIRAVLDFAQACPAVKRQLQDWVTQPKLFNDAGKKSIAPVAAAIRNPGSCETWRRTVLPAMFDARVWAHCHDELCDWAVAKELYRRLARRIGELPAITDNDLERLAQTEKLGGADDVAFPLLGLGALFYDKNVLRPDPQWIPE